jgi:hypothetical protein
VRRSICALRAGYEVFIPSCNEEKMKLVYSDLTWMAAPPRPSIMEFPKDQIMYAEPTSHAPLGEALPCKFRMPSQREWQQKSRDNEGRTYLGMIHRNSRCNGGLWPMLSKRL